MYTTHTKCTYKVPPDLLNLEVNMEPDPDERESQADIDARL